MRSRSLTPALRRRLRGAARSISVLVALAILAAVAGSALAGALDDALAKKAEGRFEEALPLFQQAVTDDPASADAALGLGEVLAGLGRYDDAVKAFGAGLEKHPEHIGLLVARARTHLLMADAGDASGADPGMILGHVADGDVWLRKALAADESSPDALVLKSKVLRYQGGGDSQESADLLTSVIDGHPEHFDANWELAMHHFREGRRKQRDGKDDWAAADRLFTRCFELDPGSGMSILNATFAKAWLGKPYAELAPGYEDAARLLPGNENALKQLYRSTGGDKMGRVAAFERVDEARPGDAMVLLYLAYAQSEAGDQQAGLSTLARAQELAPGDPFLPLNRGHILMGQDKVDEAVKAYGEATEACGEGFSKPIYDAIDLKALRTEGLSTEQRDALWEVIWKKWPEVSQGPNNAGLWYRDNSARSPQKKAMEKRSSIWYVRAVEADGQNVQILNDTGLMFHYHLADYERAEEYYRRAVVAGADQGLDWTGGDGNIDDVGYRDAINNLGKMLSQLKKWKALGKFVEASVPAGHPQRSVWEQLAKKGS